MSVAAHLQSTRRVWTEITALLAATLEAVLRIHAEGASRQAEQGPDAPPMISTELAMMHFRQT